MSKTDKSIRILLDLPDVRALLGVLSEDGEEARVVGGAIRNAAMGILVADIDIATTCVPDMVIGRARNAGWKAVPTGIAHGTITVVISGKPFEVTTLREDIATDGRHAEVRFGRDFKRDAARRDFTMNALSMGLDGIVHDYFGGLADIAMRRVRFIGDADRRLSEDYLRALRFLRFSAAYGEGKLDEAGFAAVLRNLAGLSTLSRERIRQEIIKLVMAEYALPILKAAENEGLISEVLGCSIDLQRLERRLALGDASLEARLFALMIHDEAALAHLREALRLTNAEVRFMARLIEAQRLFRISGGRAGIFNLGDQYPDVGPEALRLAVLETGDNTLLAHLPEVENPPVFHLSGADVLALGIKPGPEVASLLAATKGLWWGRGCSPDRAEQRIILAECVAALSAI